MKVPAALLALLQCPACRGSLNELPNKLVCSSCAQIFSVSAGVPDLTFFRPGTKQNDFNRVQASYEGVLHDRIAASIYDEGVVKIWGTKSELVAQSWADALGTPAGSPRILDYGCGTGQVSRVLAKQFRPLFAFDISPVSVRKNIADHGVCGCVANAFALPFKDRAFDAVCINGVLHHIVDLPPVIREISRVTAGRIFISEGVPRPNPHLRRAREYPTLLQKFLYAGYVIMMKARAFIRAVMRKLQFTSASPEAVGHLCGSRYERPLATHTVEALFQEVGFFREHLLYWTNLDYEGMGRVKRLITQALVNKKIGTHFDLRLKRNP